MQDAERHSDLMPWLSVIFVTSRLGVELQAPEIVSTDTASAFEIVFALAWAGATGGHPDWPAGPTSGCSASIATPSTAR